MKYTLPVLISLFSFGCASVKPLASYDVSDVAVRSRLEKIIVLDPVAISEKCYHPQHKIKYKTNAYYGGCYFPSDKIIYISSDCNFLEVLGHEMCHVTNFMTDEECDEKMIVKSCPMHYQFDQYVAGGTKIGVNR